MMMIEIHDCDGDDYYDDCDVDENTHFKKYHPESRQNFTQFYS